MPHHVPLIATIAVGLAVAFLLGFLVSRLRLPPIIGYLLAGIVVGPFTPGFVADMDLAPQLAELGVILLMFGVGMHFSIGDLLAVRRIAVPGAIVQIAAATVLGAAVAVSWGWPLVSGIVFGLALSVASTVVLLKALEQRGAARHGQRSHRRGLAGGGGSRLGRHVDRAARDRCLGERGPDWRGRARSARGSARTSASCF